MSVTPKTTRVYHSHRENQRERILDTAERLFIEKGLDGVSMSDIARAAHLTRNTVYEYFPNKQEVAWGIFQKLLASPMNEVPGEIQDETGFTRVEQMMFQISGQLAAHPEDLRFIVELDTLYSREGSADRMRQTISQSWAGSYEVFTDLLRQGISDGSIRSEIDADLTSAAIMNLLSGMNARFALLGELVSQEYGKPYLDIYREICRVFLRGIQSSSSIKEHQG
jgi:AcrR family transcriptional regulator